MHFHLFLRIDSFYSHCILVCLEIIFHSGGDFCRFFELCAGLVESIILAGLKEQLTILFRNDFSSFVIGLFCGFTLRNTFLEYICTISNINKEDVRDIQFRRKGDEHNSNLTITTKNDKSYSIRKSDYSFLFYLFTKRECVYCGDFMNELADISIGDMRQIPKESPEYKRIKPFQSIIITRIKKYLK